VWAAITRVRARPKVSGRPQPDPGDRLEQLERLTALRERGDLTDSEYQREKALVLSH
jgi:hypothetical protein